MNERVLHMCSLYQTSRVDANIHHSSTSLLEDEEEEGLIKCFVEGFSLNFADYLKLSNAVCPGGMTKKNPFLQYKTDQHLWPWCRPVGYVRLP